MTGGEVGGARPPSGSITIAEVLRRSTEHLAAKGSDTPRLDAERLLAKATGLERIELYMMLDRGLAEDELATTRALVARRSRREPLQYVLGEWGFRRLLLGVDPRALIPRPETEVLVDRALGLIAGQSPSQGSRCRYRHRSDRSRDRRRAPPGGGDGNRPLRCGHRARCRERRPNGTRRRAPPARPLRRPARRPVGSGRLESPLCRREQRCRRSSRKCAIGSRTRRSAPKVPSRPWRAELPWCWCREERSLWRWATARPRGSQTSCGSSASTRCE